MTNDGTMRYGDADAKSGISCERVERVDVGRKKVFNPPVHEMSAKAFDWRQVLLPARLGRALLVFPSCLPSHPPFRLSLNQMTKCPTSALSSYYYYRT